MLVNSAVVEEFPVQAAQLYTETRGAGPLLLFVVGGNGDPAVFSGVADHLADRFTVVTYARRGFVQSPVDGPIDDASRIATDVEDAVALIARHGGGPARVFGSSSGAIVALDLVTRHPEVVSTVVVHEPPILELLDDPDAWAGRSPGSSRPTKRPGCGPRWRSSVTSWVSERRPLRRPVRRPATGWRLRSRRCGRARWAT